MRGVGLAAVAAKDKRKRISREAYLRKLNERLRDHPASVPGMAFLPPPAEVAAQSMTANSIEVRSGHLDWTSIYAQVYNDVAAEYRVG